MPARAKRLKVKAILKIGRIEPLPADGNARNKALKALWQSLTQKGGAMLAEAEGSQVSNKVAVTGSVKAAKPI